MSNSLALGSTHVGDEGAELGLGQRGGRIGHFLQNGSAIERRCDQISHFAQLVRDCRLLRRQRLQSRTLGHVAGDLRRSHNHAGIVDDRRHGERHEKLRPVLASSSRFVVIDAFAGANASQHHAFFLLQFGRNDHPDGLANGLARTVAEHPLGAPIPGGDVPVQILRDDRIVGRFDNRGQAPRGMFRVFAVADVAGNLRRSDHVARLVVDRRNGQRNRERGPVFSAPDGFIVADGLTGTDLAKDEVFLVLSVGGNDHANRPADRLGSGVAKHPLGRCIPRLDDAVQVLADDGVVGRVDDLREMAKRQIGSELCHRARADLQVAPSSTG